MEVHVFGSNRTVVGSAAVAELQKSPSHSFSYIQRERKGMKRRKRVEVVVAAAAEVALISSTEKKEPASLPNF